MHAFMEIDEVRTNTSVHAAQCFNFVKFKFVSANFVTGRLPIFTDILTFIGLLILGFISMNNK